VSVNANATFGITGAGLATAIVSGPLHSVADGQNGVFGSAAGIFPNQSFNSTNYFVDLRVDTLAAAPTVTAFAPAAGATGVGTGATVSATFSRAMDPATITTASWTLKKPDGSTVPATVAYDGTTTPATLRRLTALPRGTTKPARFATAVKAADGAALASPVSWSFTTQKPAPTVTAKGPADGATGVSTGTAVSATFSRAMNPATLTS